jgi:hypothetical protein
MKASKREMELADRVAELEAVNERLALDLEWEKLNSQKLLAEIALAGKKNKKESSGTQPAKKQGKAKGEGTAQVKSKIPVDALGARQGTQGAALNSFIIPLIEKGKYEDINAANLSAMSGGKFTKGRFSDHLGWLRRKNLL